MESIHIFKHSDWMELLSFEICVLSKISHQASQSFLEVLYQLPVPQSYNASTSPY